ncbi:PREDICTED: mediator of RNA polymerase II transcription subunit 18 [Haliaeetus leucocephalus]|nr:PREDICTED: mediator of RNA polymerase II transcription subunit 18 [Haliaeetus leucocephalus]
MPAVPNRGGLPPSPRQPFLTQAAAGDRTPARSPSAPRPLPGCSAFPADRPTGSQAANPDVSEEGFPQNFSRTPFTAQEARGEAPQGGQGRAEGGCCGPRCGGSRAHPGGGEGVTEALSPPAAGSVLDQSLESLLHRLRGLCDNMEPETFLDHEMVFLLKGQQASPFVLRARRSMDKSGMPWHLRYLGQPEIGDKNRHALVRNCVDIATSDNLTDFLVEMGFRMDHEFVAKGHMFRKGIMKIVVYKIFRILMPGNTESIEPLSLSYLVELNVVAPAGQDVVSDDMRNFAEQLKPLVHLEKIDPKRLM